MICRSKSRAVPADSEFQSDALPPVGSGRHHPLLRLPAVRDNAAMQAEPSKADAPKRRRRWFQFSLRTLLIVVTLFAIVCAYVSWQMRIVAVERRDAAAKYPTWETLPTPANYQGMIRERPAAPWPLCWFGEEGYALMVLPANIPHDEIERLRKLFPEALVLPAVSIRKGRRE
jgi:hypothetical protein